MIHAIFYIHRNSAACAGVCMCDRTHQMNKTPTKSQRERNALTCFNEKLQIHLPASPYFSNCDQHKPNKFVMAALNSSHKLHGFCK